VGLVVQRNTEVVVEQTAPELAKQGVIVSCFLGLLGIAMTIYLTLFLTQPLHALHATFAGVATGK